MRQSQKPQQPSAKPRMRGHSRYRRSETARLLKGAEDAGYRAAGIEVDPVTGALRIMLDKDEPGETVENVKTLIK